MGVTFSQGMVPRSVTHHSGLSVTYTAGSNLGHKDGGALAMRVYGHLRQEHNFPAIRKVAF